MRSKEQILKQSWEEEFPGVKYPDSLLKDYEEVTTRAMDVHSKEIAIGFYKWCIENDYVSSLGTEKLYNQYLNTLIQ